MSYSHISVPQWKALQPYIRGQVVHDLGAGDLVNATGLLIRGAKKIIAVEKEPYKPLNPDIRFVQSYFHNYKEPIDIAFVAWPINHERNGLTELLIRSRVVIYIGKNTDGAACGSTDMFQHLTSRQVLVYMPEVKNTLIIYGPNPEDRPLFGEERAALNPEHIWMFNEVEPGMSA